MPLPASAAPSVVIVFGLETPAVHWLCRQLREQDPPVLAVRMPPDLTVNAAHCVVAAADAGIHVVSAARGMDGTYVEYWNLLAEVGKPRFAAVHDLSATSLDINEAAAIATRVLDEDVLPVTLPLLDDDEAVIGVLDAITGNQWLPGGHLEGPRDDFLEAVEMETNALLEQAEVFGDTPQEAIRSGGMTCAATVDVTSGAGVQWLAAHLPVRGVPAATTVLPGDGEELILLAAGPEGAGLGEALAVFGSDSQPTRVRSLVDPLHTALLDRVGPGAVAAAQMDPVPPVGAYLVEVVAVGSDR